MGGVQPRTHTHRRVFFFLSFILLPAAFPPFSLCPAAQTWARWCAFHPCSCMHPPFPPFFDPPKSCFSCCRPYPHFFTGETSATFSRFQIPGLFRLFFELVQSVKGDRDDVQREKERFFVLDAGLCARHEHAALVSLSLCLFASVWPLCEARLYQLRSRRLWASRALWKDVTRKKERKNTTAPFSPLPSPSLRRRPRPCTHYTQGGTPTVHPPAPAVLPPRRWVWTADWSPLRPDRAGPPWLSTWGPRWRACATRS